MATPLGKPAPDDWIRAYAQVQVATDQQIVVILRDAQQRLARDITRLGNSTTISDRIRYQQMAIMRRAILNQQAAVMRQLGDEVQARRLAAAARAIQLGNGLDAYVLNAIGRPAQAQLLLTSLQRGLERTVQVAMARMEMSYTALSQRIYNVDVWLGSRVDQRITAILAQGKTAREFAAEAMDWFDPTTRGGVRYAAMRLARSEINNAFHAVAVQQAQDKPWVHAMQWHLSRSHPKPDLCDEYAKEDKHELGGGIFPKADVPRKPHPHCFCYVTPVQLDEEDFLDQLTSGGFDRYLEEQRAMRVGPAPEIPSIASIARSRQ